MFRLKVITFLFIIQALLNLFFPLYKSGRLGFHSIINLVCIVLVGFGTYCAYGHFNQMVPMWPIMICRLVQFVLKVLRHTDDNIFVVSFILLIIIDFTCCMFLLADRSEFEYIEVKEGDE